MPTILQISQEINRRAVDVTVKIIILFTDDFTQLPLSNITGKQLEQMIALHVVPGRIATPQSRYRTRSP
jgi:hypothetical protein